MRREPLKPTQRATLRIKSHKPLIKLIKKDQVCYSEAPSTTNQNDTQGTYIKDIKWLGKSLYAYNIKIQYEIVFKGDRMFMLYLPSCNTRFIKGHKPSSHIRARIKSHVYTTE